MTTHNTTLFTPDEIAEFLTKEIALLKNARFGDMKPLIEFWNQKKELMLSRIERKNERANFYKADTSWIK